MNTITIQIHTLARDEALTALANKVKHHVTRAAGGQAEHITTATFVGSDRDLGDAMRAEYDRLEAEDNPATLARREELAKGLTALTE
jgi:hypothetical protein